MDTDNRVASVMSLLTCDSCGNLIDTDDHPEAYDEERDMWTCERCREDIEENED